jgi:hypothetical protein
MNKKVTKIFVFIKKIYIFTELKFKPTSKNIFMKIKEGEIAVVTKTTKFDCGVIRAYEGAIIKIASSNINVRSRVEVYLSKERENKDIRTYLPTNILRESTVEEQFKYEQGIRNINDR